MLEISFDTNSSFSEFVRDKVKEANLTQKEIAEKLNISQAGVNHALNRNNFFETRYNKTRADILELLGYSTKSIIKVFKNN